MARDRAWLEVRQGVRGWARPKRILAEVSDVCGIAGWIDWNRDLTKERDTVELMGDLLAHRGPDAAGAWLSARAGLAHRRLVVVDPAGGGQPMVRQHAGKTYVIVYNGELYNTEDIRRELTAKGWAFRSYSDTEVLLVSYMEWGEGCLPKLNGIFAFGVWCEEDGTLFLARDRLGVKPLFYAEGPGRLLFGSEMKAILAHAEMPRVIDAVGLAEVFIMGPARTPGCGVFKGISEVRPGCFLTFSRDGARHGRYWTLQSRPHEQDLATTVRTLRELLRDTVSRQLVSDVPVSTLLSGGLDSSAVTAFAREALSGNGRALRTFSIDYVGNDANFRPSEFEPDADAPWVSKVSAYLRTDHRVVLVDTPELVDALLDSMRANDLPGMADVDSSLLVFCRRVKEDVTVALSGEAADEILGGYPWFRGVGTATAETFPWARATADRAALLSPEVARHIDPAGYMRFRYEEALAEVPRLPGEDPAQARVRELFYLNITRFMPTLLDRKDRMSMAVGLEVRVPYCDHRLVEYLWNVPWDMKSCDGREKGLLRRALQGVLPRDVLYRRKSPYPKTHNPVYLGATRDLLLGVLADPSSPLRALLDVKRVRELAASDGSQFGTAWFGQLMARPQLFAYLAQVDAWLRHYRVSVE